MSTRYSIEEADLRACAPEIESLWVRNLAGHGDSSARAKLQLGYIDNPAARGTVILLRAEGHDAALGAQGLHPRAFHRGAQAIRAAGMADYVVSEKHRSLGPALLLMRRGAQIAADRFDFVYGFPNAKAVPVFVRAGFKRLGVVRRHAKLLASRTKLEARLPAWIAACGAPVLDGCLAVRDRLRRFAVTPRLECAASDWDDPSIDEIWSGRASHHLYSERSPRMLRWRFGLPERGPWRICIARSADGAPHGYVVWRVDDGFAEIGDFFSLDPESLTLSLLLAFTRLARRQKVRSISAEFFGATGIEAQLQAAGWRPRPETLAVFTGRTAPDGLLTQEALYFTRFDNDAD